MLMFCDANAWLILVKIPGAFLWICNKRECLAWPGNDTSGKLTADKVDPLSEYFASLPATSIPMFSCASCVLPPTCGVKITLSKRRNGDSNSSWFDFGSIGNTSTAAPFNLPDSSAASNAGISMTVPRAALIKIAPSFISAISAAPIISCVPAVSGICKLTTSEVLSNSFMVLI